MLHRRFWPLIGWEVPEDAGPYPVVPLEGFRAELRALGTTYAGQTFKFVVDDLLVEGDRVVATVHNEGQYPDGSPYEMAYCFLMQIRAGRIVHVKEYADTHYGFANREVGTLNMEMAATHPELAATVRTAVGSGRS
jgi:hypothetical protein